jgi:site-specific recombinase XerD
MVQHREESNMDADKRNHWFLDPGPLSPWIDQFAADLAAKRYTALTIEGYTASARHFAAWLGSAGISCDAIDDGVVRRFAEHRCRCRGGRRWQSVSGDYWRRARRFVGFLQQVGVALPPLENASSFPLLEDYGHWLRVHRGLSERTIARHLRHLHRLLPELGTATLDYNAARIRNVVREWRERTGPADLRTITSALRSYLRFLAGVGLCRPNLDHAIPPVVQWRLSSLPRYLAAADVERAIASCDQLSRGRLRDRAILLLLARLGLRAGDVAGLRLSDLDWATGMLRLSGKARRQVRLPLPQDVGDALLAYIEQERPRVDQEAVFLMMVAPYRSFSQSSRVSTIVALALKRAGISDAPSTGASLLRHSAATSMLRAGATLEIVGTVLRHRSIDMTAHYAKVDIVMLEQIAQPWPGEPAC